MVVVRICNTGQAKVTDLGENKTGQLLRESGCQQQSRTDAGRTRAVTRQQAPLLSGGRAPRQRHTPTLTCSSGQRDGSHLVSERNRLQSLAQNTFSAVCSLYLSAYPQQSCSDHLINSSARRVRSLKPAPSERWNGHCWDQPLQHGLSPHT